MGFRDEREAQIQRVAELERELALLRATEIDDLRKRVAELTRDRDALKRGVDARWTARHRRLRALFVAVVLVAVGGGALAYHDTRRAERIRLAELARAQDDVTELEADASSVHAQLADARRELAQIDAVHADDVRRVQQELARVRPPGDALQLTAHVLSRGGVVPMGVADECVMTIHALAEGNGGRCVATVWCGSQRVYPAREPSTDLRCSITASAELASAHAQRDGALPALHYDAASGTLDVRDTDSPTFVLQMHVDRMLPYPLR